MTDRKKILLHPEVVASDFLLTSPRLLSLLEYVAKTASTIDLPEFLAEKVLMLYQKRLSGALKAMHSSMEVLDSLLVRKIRRYQISGIELLPCTREYEKYLSSKLTEHSWGKLSRYWISENGDSSEFSSQVNDYLKDHPHETVILINPDREKEAGSDICFFQEVGENDLRQGHQTMTLDEFLQQYIQGIRFIDHDWLKRHLEWETLDDGAKFGLEKIDGVFLDQFFYENDVGESDYDELEFTNIKFDKRVPEFYINHGDERLGIEVIAFLYGKGKFLFKKQEASFAKEFSFYTQIGIKVKQGKIDEIVTPYFPEDTGLFLQKWGY